MPTKATLPTLDLDGVTIAYREDGPPTGAPVVLLHALASNSATWSRLTRDLVARGRRVIAPDLRGHGHSGRTRDYRLDSVQRDVVGMLDALGLAEVDLIGHSLGAHIAALLAGRRPDRVRTLVLEEPPPPPHAGESRRGKRGVTFGLSLMGVFRNFDRRMVGEVLTQLRAPDPGWWDGLAAIQAPTLVIGGGSRSHVPPDRLASVAEAIPRADLLTIDAGHRVHSTRPDEFRDAVLKVI